jgi:vacuole morphology and inheritance protein 14
MSTKLEVCPISTTYASTDSPAVYIPGQSVWIDHHSIIEILIQQLDSSSTFLTIAFTYFAHTRPAPEIIQQTALRWISSYLRFNPSTIIPFTPHLIPLILPNLAHHVDGIRDSAYKCNTLLLSVIRDLEISDVDPTEEGAALSTGTTPVPAQVTSTIAEAKSFQTRRNSNSVAQGDGTARSSMVSPPPPSQLAVPVRGRTSLKGDSGAETPQTHASGSPVSEKIPLPPPLANSTPNTATVRRPGSSHVSNPSISTVPEPSPQPPVTAAESAVQTATVPPEHSRAASPFLNSSPDSIVPTVFPPKPDNALPNTREPFDFLQTVDALRIQFMGEHEDTRVSALKWLIMLHQKIPKKVLTSMTPISTCGL